MKEKLINYHQINSLTMAQIPYHESHHLFHDFVVFFFYEKMEYQFLSSPSHAYSIFTTQLYLFLVLSSLSLLVIQGLNLFSFYSSLCICIYSLVDLFAGEGYFYDCQNQRQNRCLKLFIMFSLYHHLLRIAPLISFRYSSYVTSSFDCKNQLMSGCVSVSHFHHRPESTSNDFLFIYFLFLYNQSSNIFSLFEILEFFFVLQYLHRFQFHYFQILIAVSFPFTKKAAKISYYIFVLMLCQFDPMGSTYPFIFLFLFIPISIFEHKAIIILIGAEIGSQALQVLQIHVLGEVSSETISTLTQIVYKLY